LSFVGTAPRSGEEVLALHHDWRALYLQSKPGIVTEALVNFGVAVTEDEMYSAESVYFARSSAGYDLKLMIRYFLRIADTLFSLPRTGITVAQMHDREQFMVKAEPVYQRASEEGRPLSETFEDKHG